MRNQKGVSLITLIITIIVVIILAVIALVGANDAPTQAQFADYTNEMGGLQDSVTVAAKTTQGKEVERGGQRTDAQLYNFIARGGYTAIPATASGDEKWLVQSDARAIPCTLIDKRYAEASIGSELPVRKVETNNGTNQEMSYFVTPKGVVFSWPPFVYDGKSYVNANTTVKSDTTVDASGNVTVGTTEMADVDATASDVVIAFANGEYVKVSKASSEDVAYARRDASGDQPMTGVWYGTDVRTAPAHRGVAAGYEFSTYFNNK